MPATTTTDPELQELIDEVRFKLIVHNGEWDDIPSELRTALLEELAHRQIAFRPDGDAACVASEPNAGELMPDGRILLCRGIANEATLVHELVHAAGGQELDSEAIENHLYVRQDTDPTSGDFDKFVTENPCQYMDGKTMLVVSKFVIWDPKSGKLWFQVGDRRSPKKGKELSEGINVPMNDRRKFFDNLKKNPLPECSKSMAQKCGAVCKDFDTYGYCDRKVYQPPCYQHRAAV